LSTGLIALLDDVAGLVKLTAASLDDVATQATQAGFNAAGVVLDDAAVTPRYVVGFAAERELSIVGRIGVGSLRNKLLYLLPAALILSALAPWAITPLLMLGGAFLCYEGAEKVYEVFWPRHGHGTVAAVEAAAGDERAIEDAMVRGAIRTDFILSAEIMAITLATVRSASLWLQVAVLAIVGIGITILVYGVVGLIVKVDDVGVSMTRSRHPSAQVLGRGLIRGMPLILSILSVIGTAAMVWVGGGIILHGLEDYGLGAPGHVVHLAAAAFARAVPNVAGPAEWVATIAASGMIGLLIGAALIPCAEHIIAPAWERFRKAPAP
jgi:predicted DNA repair protein MutK